MQSKCEMLGKLKLNFALVLKTTRFRSLGSSREMGSRAKRRPAAVTPLSIGNDDIPEAA